MSTTTPTGLTVIDDDHGNPLFVATPRRATSEATNWAASAVRQAIEESGRTKMSVSELTGIPYPTLNRKLAGLSELSLVELLLLADVLKVHPSTFVPPAMRPQRDAA